MVKKSCSGNGGALKLIRKAILAPSSHNTQPWLFRVSDGVIDLLADRTRALPVNDPDDRELTISCGCALMNLRVAAAASGFSAAVELSPDGDEPNFLARLTITPAPGSPPPESALLDSLKKRRTYRKRFLSRDMDLATLDHLLEAARTEGAWLRPLSDEDMRRQVARLVAEGDAIQWANANWRSELAAWMRPRRCRDGLPVSTLTAPIVRVVVRTFDMGSLVGAKRSAAREKFTAARTARDRRGHRARLVAGRTSPPAYSAPGLPTRSTSLISEPAHSGCGAPPEAPRGRGSGFPQILLRLGYPARTMRPVPRRSLEEVIVSA